MVICDRSKEAKYAVVLSFTLFLFSILAGLVGAIGVCIFGVLASIIIAYGFYNSVYTLIFTESGIAYETYFKQTKEYVNYSYDEITIFWKNRRHTVLGIRFNGTTRQDYITRSSEKKFDKVVDFLTSQGIEIANK